LFLASMTVETPRWLVTIYMICLGFGIGTNYSVLNVSTVHGIGNEHKGAAISLITFSRTIGSALGVTILGAMQKLDFRHRVDESFHDPALASQFADPRALIDAQIRPSLAPEVLHK